MWMGLCVMDFIPLNIEEFFCLIMPLQSIIFFSLRSNLFMKIWINRRPGECLRDRSTQKFSSPEIKISIVASSNYPTYQSLDCQFLRYLLRKTGTLVKVQI